MDYETLKMEIAKEVLGMLGDATILQDRIKALYDLVEKEQDDVPEDGVYRDIMDSLDESYQESVNIKDRMKELGTYQSQNLKSMRARRVVKKYLSRY